MKLFKKTDNFQNQPIGQRIHLICSDDMSSLHGLIIKDIQQIISYTDLFFIDIARNISPAELNKFNTESAYILKPSIWSELLQGLEEIKDFYREEQKAILLILNDWHSLYYLFHNSKVFDSSIQDLLFKLKFLSDSINIMILNSDEGVSILNNWASLIVNFNENKQLVVRKNLFENLQSEKKNIYPFTRSQDNLSIDSMQPLNIVNTKPNSLEENFQSDIYKKLLKNLAEANSREDLLIVRKEIQGASHLLMPQEKISISDIYKIHLQRIKLLEDNIFGSSLSIDAS